MLERDSVMTCLPGLRPMSAAARAAEARSEAGKPGKVALAVEHQMPGLLVLQHVLRELGRERREPLVDLGDARLGLAAELGAGAHQPGMMQLQQARLLVGEAQPVAALDRDRPRGRRACR